MQFKPRPRPKRPKTTEVHGCQRQAVQADRGGRLDQERGGIARRKGGGRGAAGGATVAAIEITSRSSADRPGGKHLSAAGNAGSGFFEAYEGKHELWRRRDQKERAEDRKARMRPCWRGQWRTHRQSLEGPAEDDLFEGLVACLNAQQDRLISQATREKKYAKGRIFKAAAPWARSWRYNGAWCVGRLGRPHCGDRRRGTVLTGPSPRDGAGRWQHATTSGHVTNTVEVAPKGHGVMDLEMSREELEQERARKAPAVEANFQEGDYLPSDQGFAGSRK